MRKAWNSAQDGSKQDGNNHLWVFEIPLGVRGGLYGTKGMLYVSVLHAQVCLLFVFLMTPAPPSTSHYPILCAPRTHCNNLTVGLKFDKTQHLCDECRSLIFYCWPGVCKGIFNQCRCVVMLASGTRLVVSTGGLSSQRHSVDHESAGTGQDCGLMQHRRVGQPG